MHFSLVRFYSHDHRSRWDIEHKLDVMTGAGTRHDRACPVMFYLILFKYEGIKRYSVGNYYIYTDQ